MSQTKGSEEDMVYNEADALKAFSRVHVMQKASKLITFNTYQGRYSYKQMLFGAFASNSWTDTKKRYANIQSCWPFFFACQWFNTYVLGKEFMVETDH